MSTYKAKQKEKNPLSYSWFGHLTYPAVPPQGFKIAAVSEIYVYFLFLALKSHPFLLTFPFISTQN